MQICKNNFYVENAVKGIKITKIKNKGGRKTFENVGKFFVISVFSCFIFFYNQNLKHRCLRSHT